MKILLIGSGVGSWPNNGWGAVENLVADFSWALQQNGADVKILHKPNPEHHIEQAIQEFHPDLVHCEFDDHLLAVVHVLQKYPNIKVLLTGHYAKLSQPYSLVQDGYMGRFLFTCDIARKSNAVLAVLSKEIAATYADLGGVPVEKLWIFPNGTRTDQIQCAPAPVYVDRAVCVGKIEDRKNQRILQHCPLIDFVGPITDDQFQKTDTYKGEWTRDQLYANLTQYPCLVLMSKAEAHPLVIGEGLAAGCSILCNEISAANLPRDVPWIRIVSDSVLNNPHELTKHVDEMCKIGTAMRSEIRGWAERNLDWRLRAASYLDRWFPGQRIMKTAPVVADSLRIALIGPGIMSIPPTGWGAVEQIIWDKAVLLRQLGHTVEIINTRNQEEIVQTVNNGNFDIVHLHYDVYWNVIPKLTAKIRCVTSWYPYIDNFAKWQQDNYGEIFQGIASLASLPNVLLFPASEKDRQVYIQKGGVDPARVFLYKNGIHTKMFELKETPHFANRTVCLAKIEPRKRQHLTYWCNSIDYIGRGEFHHPNYRGEVGHDVLYKLLTEYGNLVMLSDGENGTPLVVKEGMAGGLGCVLSESAANELPALPWVTVIPEKDLANPVLVQYAIETNRQRCLSMRKQIREWVVENWDLERIMSAYVEELRKYLR